MKILKSIFAVALLCTVMNAYSQVIKDFVVIDEIADNLPQLQAQFKDKPNVYWTTSSSLNALRQIENTTKGMLVERLHIYTPTKPGAIVFSSIAITSRDVSDVEEELKALRNFVSKSVVIHSEIVFTGEEGQLLKQQLEEITGLLFTTQN